MKVRKTDNWFAKETFINISTPEAYIALHQKHIFERLWVNSCITISMQCDSAPYDSSDMQFETGQQEKSMQVRACGQVIDHENF